METSLLETEWDAAIRIRRARLLTADAEERFQLYCEIGDLYSDGTDNLEHRRSGALQAYCEAHILKPLSLDHNRHFRLLELASATDQWRLMIEIFLREACAEKDYRRKGMSYYKAGVICRDALKSNDAAIEQFNLALDAYFESTEPISEQDFSKYFKPLVAIDKICITRKDWTAQVHNYHKQIERLPKSGQEAIRAGLWNALADVYRYHLGDHQSAIGAFDVAVQLEPDRHKRHEILAKLGIRGNVASSTG